MKHVKNPPNEAQHDQAHRPFSTALQTLRGKGLHLKLLFTVFLLWLPKDMKDSITG